MRVIFNSPLLQKLVDILTTSFSEIARNAACSHDTISRCLQRGDIRFDSFIRIVNHYHLNIGCFFIPVNEEYEPQSNVVLTKRSFKPLVFDPSIVTDYQQMADKMWCKDVAEWMTLHNNGTKAGMPVTVNGEQYTISLIKVVARAPKQTKEPKKSTKKKKTAITFNTKLLFALPSAIGISRSDIGRTCGRDTNMYTYAVRQEDIRMRSLVQICNKYHVDIYKFFLEDEYIPMSVIVPESKWQEIEFHPERLMDFADGRTQNKLLEKLNYSKQRLYRNVDPENTPMTARNFVDACNKLNVSPQYFFVSAELASDQRIARKLNEELEAKQQLIEELESRLKEKESSE